MSSLTLSVPKLRQALQAVHALTGGSGREWCTAYELAEMIGCGSNHAIVLLGHLHELDLVVLLGSSRRHERRWRLTDDGLDALDEPRVPAGCEGSE